MMLAKLASYTVVFEHNTCIFRRGATFNKLTVYFSTHDRKPVSSTVSVNGNQAISKILAFTLPTFQGDTMNGDSYLEGIELAFKSAAMVDFITDETHCNN